MKVSRRVLIRAAIIMVLAVAMAFLYSYKGTIPPAVTAIACVAGVLVIFAVWKW